MFTDYQDPREDVGVGVVECGLFVTPGLQVFSGGIALHTQRMWTTWAYKRRELYVGVRKSRKDVESRRLHAFVATIGRDCK